jgi:DNA-directed RNA polymerase
MAYGARERRNAHVRVGGIRSTALVYAESEAQIDRLRQTDAISPNVIHALDAAALVFALDEMEDISRIAAIHDCVGGLAPEMTMISRAVRDGFARLYGDHDPLQVIYAAALAELDEDDRHRLQVPPKPGALDVRAVCEAGYFFS